MTKNSNYIVVFKRIRYRISQLCRIEFSCIKTTSATNPRIQISLRSIVLTDHNTMLHLSENSLENYQSKHYNLIFIEERILLNNCIVLMWKCFFFSVFQKQMLLKWNSVNKRYQIKCWRSIFLGPKSQTKKQKCKSARPCRRKPNMNLHKGWKRKNIQVIGT